MKFRSRHFAVLAAGAILALSAPNAGRADEQNIPLVVQGDWGAFAHSDSAVDAPDLCMAMQPTSGFAFRIDDSGDIDIRLVDSAWSLPANVDGEIKVAVNGHSYSYDITSNTSTMVDASVTQDQLSALVKDMELANSMTIIAGSGVPKPVSLNGSSAVLTALLTCANIPNPTDNTGGSNPFSSSSN